MIEFFRLSYRKLFIVWMVVSLLFFVIISVLMTLMYVLKGDSMEKIDSYLLTAIYGILGCIGMVFPIMIMVFVSEYQEFHVYRKVFQKVPFSQLSQVGFAPTPLLTSGIWKLYKEVRAARINNFYVVAEQSGKAMTFTILVEEKLGVKKVPIEHFRDAYISSGSTGVVVVIPIDSYSTPGIGLLQSILTNLTLSLTDDGFHPAPDFSPYEKKLKRDVITQAARAAFPG